jgi:phage regulator Rha-like protein
MKPQHPLLQSNPNLYTPSDIIDIACYYLETPKYVLLKRTRQREHVLARMYIFDLLYSNKTIDMTLQKIGNMFGMHHSSVVHSMQTLKNYLDVYEDVRTRLEHLHLVIYNHLDYFTFIKKGSQSQTLIENKNRYVTFRISETEFNELVTISMKKNQRFTEYIRNCVLCGMNEN